MATSIVLAGSREREILATTRCTEKKMITVTDASSEAASPALSRTRKPTGIEITMVMSDGTSAPRQSDERQLPSSVIKIHLNSFCSEIELRLIDEDR